MCESFFATLECELLERRRFVFQAEAGRCRRAMRVRIVLAGADGA